MFIPKDLLFTQLKRNIKLFLGKYGLKAPGVHDKEYWEALSRYKVLVNDISLQDKLQELSLLEAIIIQTHCMQNLDPVVMSNKTAKNPCLYARQNYPTIKGTTHVLTKSLGPRNNFPGNLNSLIKKPEIIDAAKVRIRQAMEENFIYKAYKIRYPN